MCLPSWRKHVRNLEDSYKTLRTGEIVSNLLIRGEGAFSLQLDSVKTKVRGKFIGFFDLIFTFPTAWRL